MNSKKTLLLAKITKKLTSNSVSLAKLQQIYDILDVELIVEPTIVETVQEHVPWIEFAKNYSRENNMNYKDAIVEIKQKGLYKPKAKNPKKALKRDAGYSCDTCDYTTPNKSNFNRHITKHNNKERMMNELMTVRGLIRTHRVRAEKSKDSDVKLKSQSILEDAIAKERVLVPQLKKLQEKGVTYKKPKSKTNSKDSMPIGLIEQTNRAYKEANGTELGLTSDMIENVEKDGPDYTLKVKSLSVDDDEEIDEIIYEYDDQVDGYSVSLMQSVDIKGKMTDVEYESFFVYRHIDVSTPPKSAKAPTESAKAPTKSAKATEPAPLKNQIKKIQKLVEKNGKTAYYLVEGDTVKLLARDLDSLAEKISEKKKYINKPVFEVNIVVDGKYVGVEHKLVAGPVSLKMKQYHVDDKYKLKYKSGYANGAVWYTNHDIADGAFHVGDIKKIVKIIHDNNVNILSMGKVRAVDMLNENFD